MICDAVSYSCSLAAFNDLGEGPCSMEVEIFLQCNRESEEGRRDGVGGWVGVCVCE